MDVRLSFLSKFCCKQSGIVGPFFMIQACRTKLSLCPKLGEGAAVITTEKRPTSF